MFCEYCGKETAENSTFCNKCGKRLAPPPLSKYPSPENTLITDTPETRQAVSLANTTVAEKPAAPNKFSKAISSINGSSVMKTIFCFIDLHDSKKLCFQFSAAFLVFLLTMRLLGSLFLTIIVTALNSFLIYYSYKKEKKINYIMIIWAAAAFAAGIILSII